MRRTASLTLLAALVGVLAALPALAQGENPSFNLVNRGSSAVRELYVTPAGDARWGQNRIERPIAPGTSFAVRRRIDGNCLFDIRAVFADGRTEDRRGLNTCTVDDVAVGTPAGGAAPARLKAADDPSFRLVNRGSKAITEAFARAGTTGDWGENRVGPGPLPPGTDRVLAIPRDQGCVFDLRVVFADHTAKEKRRTDLCRVTDLPVQ